MERQLIFLILVLGIVWVILDELFGTHKYISKLIKAAFGS